MNERSVERRIRLANEALPDSLKTEGRNPLSLIYDRLSEAIHRNDDQECMEVAKQTSKLLEHIVTRLMTVRRQQIEREEYEKGLDKLRKAAE